MKLREIVAALARIAPPEHAADWDNVGLIVGSDEDDVARVLVSNEMSAQTLSEAQATGAQLLVSYHPPLLQGVRALTPTSAGATLYQAARHRIAVVVVHTGWDVAAGGVNDHLAQAAGLSPERLVPLVDGMGRFGTLAVPQSLDQLAQQIRAHMQLPFALLAQGSRQGAVRRIAVAAGAGDSFIAPALAAGAELLVTGELRHHNMLALLAQGAAALCLTHCGSERKSLDALIVRLNAELGADRPVIVRSQADGLPWRVV